jgi:cytoskeleton protein RodZ
MSMNPSDHIAHREEPHIYPEAQRAKPDGDADPAGEVGWFLMREREARGLTLEDAAEATGIHPYHIEAIEYGDLTHMPPRLEATEMIAGYAQFLGFDVEPLIAHLLSFLPPPPVSPRMFHPASPPVLSSAKVLTFGKMPRIPDLKIRLANYPGGIVASLFAAFLAVAGTTYMFASPQAGAPVPTEQVAQAEAPPQVSDPMPTASTGQDAATVTVTDAPLPVQEPIAVATAPATTAADNADDLGNFIQQQIPTPKAVQKSVKPVAPAQVATADDGRAFGTENEDSHVILKAKAPVWLRIEDTSGNVVMTQMLNTGDTYKVPNRPGLVALSRDGGRLAYLIDGKEAGVLGPPGQILIGEKIDVASLSAKK